MDYTSFAAPQKAIYKISCATAQAQQLTTPNSNGSTMDKRVILVTGTPCVGKTTLARKLSSQLNSQYVNLTDLAKTENITLGRDPDRQTTIVDESKMRRKLRSIIEKAKEDIVIDGHFAAAVTPKSLVTHVFVLRRNPIELRILMQKCEFKQSKQDENLSAEILDVCLVEALHNQKKSRVCEVDVSGKSVDETLAYVMAVLDGKRKCFAGCVDWMSMLEREGKLDEFLKP